MSAPPEPSSQSPPAQPPPPAPTSHTGSPTDFLKGVVGKRVVVRLVSGVDYQGMSHHFVSILLLLFFACFYDGNYSWSRLNDSRNLSLSSPAGILSCLDGFMNIALEQTEELVNGAITNRYGDAFVRGNNGFCSPSSSCPSGSNPIC